MYLIWMIDISAPSFYKAMVSEKRNQECIYLHGAEFKKKSGIGRKKL